MTIAAAYLTSEGIVLGADSKTTFMTTTGERQLLDHAQKVYEIGEKSRFGFCTFGLGKIGDLSHRTVAAKVADSVNLATATLDDVVAALVGILQPWASGLTSNPGMGVGYLVGGVDPVTRTPRCARVVCSFTANPGGGTTFAISRMDLPIGAGKFDGAPEYFTRIIYGCAEGLPEAIRDGLKATVPGLPADFDQKFDSVLAAVRPRFVSAGAGDLPLREAIDMVHTYLQLTVKAFKFRIGPPLCGGPIEIAYISTDRPFRWAKHKTFDSAIRENETWTR